jgi:hypothetical protein
MIQLLLRRRVQVIAAHTHEPRSVLHRWPGSIII